jgi:ADP-ribosyl-[dinitrogen reductase] hydrolase
MSKIRDAFFGLAVGDALGVPYELAKREELAKNPVTNMVGHLAHNQPAGTWSDDASMTFCAAESLLEGFSTRRMGLYFLRWFDNGWWSAHGKAFGSGGTTRKALKAIRGGWPPEQAGSTHLEDNGNGSLMRIIPMAFYLKSSPVNERMEKVAKASMITHAHPIAVMSCFYYVEFAIGLLQGKSRREVYDELCTNMPNIMSEWEWPSEDDTFSRLLMQDIWELPQEDILSSSYVVHTLEASIWCLMTTDSYEEAVLKAVNLGGDSDSTAAVTGGLAGIVYGINSIPSHWKMLLARGDDISNLCDRFEHALENQSGHVEVR